MFRIQSIDENINGTEKSLYDSAQHKDVQSILFDKLSQCLSGHNSKMADAIRHGEVRFFPVISPIHPTAVCSPPEFLPHTVSPSRLPSPEKILVHPDPGLYHFINQGSLTVDTIDDKEEMEISDVGITHPNPAPSSFVSWLLSSAEFCVSMIGVHFAQSGSLLIFGNLQICLLFQNEIAFISNT